MKTSMAQVVTVRTDIDSEGSMKTIRERGKALLRDINLITLKTEILSALSSVSSATTTEELQWMRRIRKLFAQPEAWAIVLTSEQRMASKFRWSGWPWAKCHSGKISPMLRDRGYDIQRGKRLSVTSRPG
jgi:hypothetical protein